MELFGDSAADLARLDDPRDLQILTALAAGRTRKEIARELFMSQANVAYRIRQMSKQFGTRGCTALVAMALYLRLLSLDEWPIGAARERKVHSFTGGSQA